MAYNNGTPNAHAAAALGWLRKTGAPPPPAGAIDDSKINNFVEYEDNAAGTGKIHYLVGANASNQTDLANPNGVLAWALQIRTLATPATPTITNAGTAGGTSYAYKIVAKSGLGATLGSTPASSAGSTSTGNATLTTTNYNVVTFAKVTGAASYDVYRTTAGGTPSTTGLIGSVLATVNIGTGVQTATYAFNDTGLAGDGAVVPSANTTGSVSIPILAGSITVPVIGTPAGVTATPHGTAGSTTDTYKIVARGQVGTSAASSAASSTTSNATLDTTNYNVIAWDAVPDAVSYDIYRTVAGGTPSTTGLIANVLAPIVTYNDQGAAGDSSTPPTTNTTGAINLARLNDVNGNAEIIFSATTSAVNQLTVANAATANSPTITTTGSDTNIGITVAGKGTGAVNLGQATSTGVVFLADQPINDSSGNPQISFVKTASAVNGIGLANSATGNGTNNAVTVAPIGTDSAVGLTVATKGAAGILTVGLSNGTGDLVVGSSSGAQSVKVANGAGAPTVNIANVSTAGATVAIAGAATGAGLTDAVTIAGGNAAATGIKAVSILGGTPGTSGNNRLTVGNGTTTKATINAAFTSYQAVNLIATETGSNNAIAGALTDASGSNVTLAAGLRVCVILAHTLQAGANTFVFNGTSKAIKKATNAATDLSTAFASTGIIDLIYDGTQFLCMSQ